MPYMQLFPGARGLDFEGGGSVRADRRGRVFVDDDTAAAIRASSAKRRYDSIIEIAPASFYPSTSDPTCDICGRTLFDWQGTRCGSCREKSGASM